MAILESVKELASKLGAETNGRDITDQLNKINKHLDETALSGRDIAEAVKTYSENASGGGGGGETFEVEVELTFDGAGIIIAVNKTYQQIKSEMDLGKTITGTFKETYDSAVLTSGELSNSYIKDFYGNSSTKEASDAIFIVTEPFFTPDDRVSSIASFVITPDNKVFYTIARSWGSNPET